MRCRRQGTKILLLLSSRGTNAKCGHGGAARLGKIDRGSLPLKFDSLVNTINPFFNLYLLLSFLSIHYTSGIQHTTREKNIRCTADFLNHHRKECLHFFVTKIRSPFL